MSKIESDKVQVSKSSEEVFTFLSDFNNFEKLMPEQVSDWKADKESCSFNIKGLASIGMRIVEKKPNNYIKIVSDGKVPFNFTLNVYLNEIDKTKTEGQLIFESDMNPFMKMMAEKPLKNFFNMLAGKLKDLK